MRVSRARLTVRGIFMCGSPIGHHAAAAASAPEPQYPPHHRLQRHVTHADAVVMPGKGVAMQHRSGTGASSANVVIIGGSAPVWFRLRRFDNPSTGVNGFSTWYSTDRLIWRRLGDVSLSSASAANIGLAITSHHTGVETTAVFEDVRIQQ